MKGITVGIQWRGQDFPAAFMRIMRAQGGEEEGWSGPVAVYAKESAFDAAHLPMDTFTLCFPAPGRTFVSGTVAESNAPKAIGATLPEAATEAWNPDPFAALYGKLLKMYPGAVAVP